ncbi:MAG: IS1 family transposase [Methylobacter sp.]|nr:IS1 family transposase [Methylobacter sp.]
MDEQWSYVGKKSEPRWLWYTQRAQAPLTMPPVGYWLMVFGRRKDDVFKQLKALLEPFNISRLFMPFGYTDDWGAYERHLDVTKHQVGKQNTQKIERKNLNLRTWIKRLTRKTICFSKSVLMHDTVIGLLINKVEFGVDIHAKLHI